MKKKAIEKIPYLGLPEIRTQEGVKYIGVTELKDVAGEQHLFLEVYRNSGDCREVPAARIVMREKDFGTYFPGAGTWSRQKCVDDYWREYPVWYSNEERVYRPDRDPVQESILYSADDLERIREFCRMPSDRWEDRRWWKRIYEWQNRITAEEQNERRNRQYERRQQALKERMDATPEFSEEEILKYAEQSLLFGHRLYYKKGKVRAEVACSACGRVTSAKWKDGGVYEDQFEKHITEPRAGLQGICPMCGKIGTFVPQGRAQREKSETRYLFLGQKYKATGVVFRYFDVRQDFGLEYLWEDHGMEMTGAREDISGREIARAYFEPGKKRQTDYHKRSFYSGKDYWDDCNLYGLANISVGEARIVPETWENLQGTILQYSAMQEYYRAVREINAFNYAERYLQTPQIEMLVKIGLTDVVRSLVNCHYGIVADENANRPDQFLGIRKEHVKILTESKGNLRILKVLQDEKRLGQRWTDEQVKRLAELEVRAARLATILGCMSVQQFINRVAKYAGCGYDTGCSHADYMLKQTALLYSDYLGMRKELGYDLSNGVYQCPRNLRIAHNRMVLESNQEKGNRHAAEMEEKYPEIRKLYRRLRREFYYGDEEFLIRPARSAMEIVSEGRILHHCVGRDDYLSGHNAGDHIILFLRFREDPDTPYVTIEIDREYHICQWYGAFDRKPDPVRIDRWLNAYVTRLKCGGASTGAAQDAVGEPVEQIMQVGA